MPTPEVALTGVDWTKVVGQITDRGWVRLPAMLAGPVADALEAAAPDRWQPVLENEGGGVVRQAGLSSNIEMAEAAEVVRSLAAVIEAGISQAAPAAVPLPSFNHAQWSRTDGGRKFITPHRDPPTAAGMIVVATLRGKAEFRAWEIAGGLEHLADAPAPAAKWVTGPGDLVLLRGGNWPAVGCRCPIHEAGPAITDERLTLTLRHNIGGFGSDYFPSEPPAS